MKTSHPPSFSNASTRSAMPLLMMLRSVHTITRLPSSWLTLRSSSKPPQPKNTRPAEENPQCRLLADCGTELFCGMPNLLWMRNSTHEPFFPQPAFRITRNGYLLESRSRLGCPQFIQVFFDSRGQRFPAGKCLRIDHNEQVSYSTPKFRIERAENFPAAGGSGQ